MHSIGVFCGSHEGSNPIYLEQAKLFGSELARRNIRLIYGGGTKGLMGAVANTCLANKGTVIGVIPEHLLGKEGLHQGLQQLHIVKTMHERKYLMSELADAFIALPGGFGTFEEFCEIVTWRQIGLHDKPCAILNTAKYYDPLLDMFTQAATELFTIHPYRDLILVDENPIVLIERVILSMMKS